MGDFDPIKLSYEGRQKLREAYRSERLTQQTWADKAHTSVDSVKRLLGTGSCPNGVERWIATKIVRAVGFELEDLSPPEDYPLIPLSEDISIAPQFQNIEALIEATREQICGKIQILCSMMRVLEMSQPIDLNQIFTKVNILEKIRGRQRRELSDLLENLPNQDFERFNLGNLLEERVPGLAAVERFQKLIILGRPGAGKTTFLKYLAMQCIARQETEVRQLEQLIPFFITLKDFAEAPGQPDLLSYIQSQFEIDSPTVQLILNNGRALILLDGLDEVRENDRSAIMRRIEEFTKYSNFHKSKFIITCRLAAAEYNFENFTEVEIADFEDEQISYFVKGWFNSKNNSKQANKFLEKLNYKDNKPIRELAANPLLLTLLCYVFEDSGRFPAQRSELYKEGLDILLKKWDAKRYVERPQPYRTLSLKHKESLLSQIAYLTFTTENYVFRQEKVECKIVDYMLTLSNHHPDEPELNGEVILKSIEAQHGLLVERAKRIYSFSHLTFHEYYVAKHIVANCDPNSMDSPMLRKLMGHLTNRSWREVFLLTSELLEHSNSLLRLMKIEVDRLLTEDPELQAFLRWVDEKARSLFSLIGKTSSLAAIRACYLDFDIALDPDRTLGWLINRDFTCNFACASFLARAKRCEVQDIFKEGNSNLQDLISSPDLEPALVVTFARNKAIKQLLAKDEDPQLGQELQQLARELPPEIRDKGEINEKLLRKWLKEEAKNWGDRLRSTIVRYHSLGGLWRYEKSSSDEQRDLKIQMFNERQRDLLNQYYYANLLLVVCLRSDCRIDPEVRREIEETLLLPAPQV